MGDYGLKVEKNMERNEKYIQEFEKWLKEKGLAKNTIKKHLKNVNLYINHYLHYYEIVKMEEGVHSVSSFLGDWFIEKCLWASKTSIKDTATSIKKFYQCMSEYNYVQAKDYNSLCRTLKDEMDEYLDRLQEFDDEVYYDTYD